MRSNRIYGMGQVWKALQKGETKLSDLNKDARRYIPDCLRSNLCTLSDDGKTILRGSFYYELQEMNNHKIFADG